MSTETIIIRPAYLRELREIADEEGVSLQSLVDKALSDFVRKKNRQRFPEFMKHFDESFRDNRKLYELLAEGVQLPVSQILRIHPLLIIEKGVGLGALMPNSCTRLDTYDEQATSCPTAALGI